MAHVETEPATAADPGDMAKTKKPYVRLMTDKRREQNRKAQKIYREKLKRKLENLEEQVAEKETEPGPQNVNRSLPDPVAPSQQPSATLLDPSVPPSHLINLNGIFDSAGDLSIASSVAPSFPYPVTPPSPTPLPQTGTPPPNDVPVYKPLDIWRMPHRPAGTPYTPPPTATASYMSGALTAVSPDYAWLHQIRRLHARPSSPRPHESPNPRSRLPSPYTNNLTLTSETNISASLSIALSLGISSTAYLEDHPSMFPSCFEEWWPAFSSSDSTLISTPEYVRFTQSPWDATKCMYLFSQKYSPTETRPCSSADGYVNTVAVNCPKFRAAAWAATHGHETNSPSKLREHLSRVKPPLRPRPVQMLHSHPTYLDCIVFPRFRERAVQASVDGTLDHVEFFLDLMHGGLVCWGSSSPHAGSRRKRRRGMADAVPWSTRSWEARRWFLGKSLCGPVLVYLG